jgi:hypothetical protein
LMGTVVNNRKMNKNAGIVFPIILHSPTALL